MGAGDDLLRLRERQRRDTMNTTIASDGRIPLSLYVIGKSPLGKFSRQRLMETVVRLDQRVAEAVADEEIDAMNFRILEGLHENTRTALSEAVEAKKSVLDDLSRSRARELAMAAQVGRWKRRFYAGLAIFIISLLVCISLWA